MDWHALKKEEVFSKVKSSEKGISNGDALERLKKYGKNDLGEVKKKSKLKIFLSQFNSLIVYILIVASIISIFIGHILDAVVIFSVVILNSIIGFVQEYKAEEIIEKLKKALAYKVRVLRDGKEKEIDSKSIVPGDILILEEGDKVLADCRIFEMNNLQVDEAVLTGESFPVSKKTESLKEKTILAERKNMLYAGTTIVKGNCKAVVVATGLKTEFGKLAELVKNTEDEKMPLEKKMDVFSRNISIAIILFVIVAFFVGIYAGIDKIEMFLVSVSLMVAAIPSGLPAVIVITLAVAIKRMYKSKTLIRKLPAAETLGRATIICTDKTGTLTEEKLSVDEIYAGGRVHAVEELDKINSDIKDVLQIGVLCNNARDNDEDIVGDPTEIALVKSGKEFEINKQYLTEQNPRVKEFPFTSERKMMTIVRERGRIKTAYIKGAGDIILDNCTKELFNGKLRPLTEKRKKELERIYEEMSGRGLRVLGFAFKKLPSSLKLEEKKIEERLVFAGFQGMIDRPREEVKKAMMQAMEAGIEVKVITGDAALTTKAIANKLGLHGEIVEGEEMSNLNDRDWDKLVRQKTIFARITPEQKLKIIEILKKQKETVAVTGDGVNDILALKKADIGVAMGVRGSDVARDSSDMVLMDDNFASIVKAIKEGRRIFDNMKKSIKFLLSANVGEVFMVVFTLLLGLPLPLLPLALLWMNLVTDSLPALALAVEPAEEGVMKRKPRKDELLSGIWHWFVIAGILGFLSSFLVFKYSLDFFGLEIARTMATTAIIFFELFFAFSCKTEKSLFRRGILDNKWLIYSVLLSAGLHILVIYTPASALFKFVPLTGMQLGISILAGTSGLIFFEGMKIINEVYEKYFKSN